MSEELKEKKILRGYRQVFTLSQSGPPKVNKFIALPNKV